MLDQLDLDCTFLWIQILSRWYYLASTLPLVLHAHRELLAIKYPGAEELLQQWMLAFCCLKIVRRTRCCNASAAGTTVLRFIFLATA